jgi:hypothetical protein
MDPVDNVPANGGDAAPNDLIPCLYLPEVGNKITPKARELLEIYSKIPADKVKQHVCDVVRLYC